MPPNNRLAPPVQNAFGAPPTFAGMQAAQNAPNRGPAYTTSDRLDDVSRGLGTGFTNVLQGNADLARALFTDPKALAAQLAQAAISLGAHPSKIPGMVSNAMHNMWSQASSSPEGLGEVVGANIDPRNWLKPRKGPLMAGIFVGSKSKTWNSNAAAAAVQMETKGVSPEKIWDATGTWRGPDGNWRQEIVDKDLKFKRNFSDYELSKKTNYNYLPAESFDQALSAPELTAAYPQVKTLGVETRKRPDWMPASVNNGEFRQTIFGKPDNVVSYATTEPSALDTMAHEFQHAVQKYEDFAPGGTPKQFYREIEGALKETNPQKWAALSSSERGNLIEAEAFKRYRNLMGEAEARATASRRNLSWLERRQRFPGLDYDVPMSELTK